MMHTFFNCCEHLAIPTADEKTEGPTTVIVFLGLEIDSVLMQVRIPTEKIKVLVDQILYILKHKRSVQLQELQSLIGSLNFMCRAIVPGLPFCRHLIDTTGGIT